MKLIIVEDDRILREALSLMLAESGHEVSFFQSATDLLYSGFELPNLFVIDWRLRGMSGMDLCRRLKNDPITGYIPVYIMTAANHAETEAEEAGAEGVISKPFRKNDLLQILDKHASLPDD